MSLIKEIDMKLSSCLLLDDRNSCPIDDDLMNWQLDRSYVDMIRVVRDYFLSDTLSELHEPIEGVGFNNSFSLTQIALQNYITNRDEEVFCKNLRQAIKLDDFCSNIWCRYILANQLGIDGDYSNSSSLFRDISSIHDQFYLAHQGLMNSLDPSSEYNEISSVFSKVPSHLITSDMLFVLSCAHREHGRPDLVIALYERYQPSSDEEKLVLAKSIYELGYDYYEVFQVLNSMNDSLDSQEVLSLRGWVLFEIGQYEEAEKVFLRNIKVFDTEICVLDALGFYMSIQDAEKFSNELSLNFNLLSLLNQEGYRVIESLWRLKGTLKEIVPEDLKSLGLDELVLSNSLNLIYSLGLLKH